VINNIKKLLVKGITTKEYISPGIYYEGKNALLLVIKI
jgi:hypothetical protein